MANTAGFLDWNPTATQEQPKPKAMGYDDRDALYGHLRDHHLRIGDSQFYVPPTSLTVSKRMKNNRVNILRGRGSFVKDSGYFDMIIDMTLFFPDMQSINNELRPLIAQVRKCPFLPISNTLLNNVYKMEAVTIANISVQTVQGFPHALQASIQMYAFNPYTYISDDTGRTFEEFFNWPLFRWYYQRNLKPPKPDRPLVFYEPLQMDLHNDYMFQIADENDLALMKDVRMRRDAFIKKWMDDKSDKRFLATEDYWWVGPVPIPKIAGTQMGDNWNDETDETLFFQQLTEDQKHVIDEYDIHMINWDIPGLILEELSISYENVITSLQLQGQESPTHQYMGSQDAMFVARFKTDDEEALGSLENMIRESHRLVRDYHKFISNGFLTFSHQLTRLFGVNYVIIEDLVTSTVDGQPGVYEITLTLGSYNRAQRKLAETNKINDQLKWETPWKTILDPFTWPFANEDPLGGYKSLDVMKKALYDQKVKELLKMTELYPDLELPTYKEVAAAGFDIPNLNDGQYVDPDFFLIYSDPIDQGEQLMHLLKDSFSSEIRDYVKDEKKIVGGKIVDGAANNSQEPNAIINQQPPIEMDQENLTSDQMETLLREKAKEVGISQELVVGFAKAFDTKLRQFYDPGYGANKDLGNMEVDQKNIPVMIAKDGRYYKDPDFLRDAMYIGVMKVSPLMGDARGLAYNILFNAEQGCQGLLYYIDLVKKGNLVNENVYRSFGLVFNGTTDEHEQAQWVGAVAMYLGYDREYRQLLNNNKKLPYALTMQIKRILQMTKTAGSWNDQQIQEKYSQLKIPDYKKVSMNGGTYTNTEKTMVEDDFSNHEEVFKEMFHDSVKYDRRGRLVRAFPTFFMIFIDEGQYLGSVKLSDQFFGYRAVSDISFTNNRKLASSTLALEMCNVFGSLSDAVKGLDLTHTSLGDVIDTLLAPSSVAEQIENSRNIGGDWNKSIYLRTGARVHFRMGYGSNPMNMPTTINGVVTELTNNGETVSVVVQDDGIELTNKLKASPPNQDGTGGDQTRGFLFSGKEPSVILDELFTDDQGIFSNMWKGISSATYQKHSLGIMHFGFPGKPIDSTFMSTLWNDRPRNEITMNIYDTSGYMRQDQEFSFMKGNLFIGLEKFFNIDKHGEDAINMNLYDKSVWDVLNVCAGVAEDFVVAVHPFDFRNTIFFGKPYFPLAYGYQTNEPMSNLTIDELNKKSADLVHPMIQPMLKPFRQYHMFDSWTSIVDNTIQATAENMYTVAVGVYHNEGNLDTTEPIYVDTNIYPELQRTVMIDTQLNIQGVRLVENIPMVGQWLNKPLKWYFDEWTAIKITSAGLRDYVKEMYDGYLTVIGDPSVKPYDQFFMVDNVIEMSGPAEVREVNQLMNFDVGYVTMIKPDCIVVNSDQASINFTSSANHIVTMVYATTLMRHMMRSIGFAGAYPILNATWAATKRGFNAMRGKFDDTTMGKKVKGWAQSAADSKMANGARDWWTNKTGTRTASGPVYEIDPVTGEVREYAPVSTKTLERWKKSDLLKKFAMNIGNFTVKDAENLFDHIDDALYNRRFMGYHKVDYAKIAKLRGSMSKVMFGGLKIAGNLAKWAIMGTELLMGPPGWLAFLIENSVMTILTSTIGEMIQRWLYTRKAVMIVPLKKDGIEFTAGINGHLGSVVGDSPDAWQRILTTGPGSVLMSFLFGIDTTNRDISNVNPMDLSTPLQDPMSNLFGTQAAADETPPDINALAQNFFYTYRKKVYHDTALEQRYNLDKDDAKKEMEGHKQTLDAENARKATYPEKSHFDIKSWLQNLINGKSGGKGATGASFSDMDLNKPSGISAEAIDAAFAKYGPSLQGLGQYFKQLETEIPPSPQPMVDVGGGSGRTLNALYLAAHAAWETGWGESRIFKDKNNLFGYGAYDNSPYESAYTFATPQDCVFYAANKIKDNYLTEGGPYYNGPTLKGMNVKYATDQNWHQGIADIMAMIAKFDPNFKMPGTADHAQVTGEVPDTFGREGKDKYHLETESEASAACVDLKSASLQNVGLTLVSDSGYIRQASLDMVEQLGKVYTEQTGDKLNITSSWRAGDPDWHGTGFAVDVDTPDCGYIAGRPRFPKGSKDKDNLTTLMDLAIQVGFDGIIHGDVDVVADLKAKYPDKLILQMDDHFNHFHMSYPTK
jgi:beta-N-acetylglucosaminidase